MIDQTTIERIFDAAEIVEVIQEFITLKRKGVNYLGLCPFHNEKTPSFSVSPTKGIYKCFGCGKGGNAVNFIMEHDHMTYPEALKYLARKYHIEVVEKEPTAEEIQQQNERESLQVVTTYAQKYFTETLFHSVEGMAVGLSYFKERGFRQELLKKFQLGYCPDQKDEFTQSALKAGYKLDFLVKSGLTVQRDTYVADRFSGRVLFPIHGLSGVVIGFGGRTLKQDQKTAKYINSPESDIYHKSRALYGIYHARKSIVAENNCYLVEGYTDVLSLHQAGIENVVASSGTALTPEQIRLIKRFTPNITILYDGDEAGVKASLRSIDLILEEGMNVKVLLLPDEEDPDSYLKKLNTLEFRNFLKLNAQDFIHFKTQLLVQETKNDPVKRAEMIRDVVRSIAIIPDSITRSVYIKECSTWLEIEEGILYMEINKARRKKAEQNYQRLRTIEDQVIQKVPQRKREPVILDTEAQERELLRLLLTYGNKEFTVKDLLDPGKQQISVAEFIINEVINDDLELSTPVYKHVFEECQHQLNQYRKIDQKYFIHHTDKTISDVSADLLSETYNGLSKIWVKHENYIESEEMRLKVVLLKTLVEFKNKKLMMAIRQIEVLLKKAQETKSEEEIEELQERFIGLNNIKKQLSKDLGERIIL